MSSSWSARQGRKGISIHVSRDGWEDFARVFVSTLDRDTEPLDWEAVTAAAQIVAAPLMYNLLDKVWFKMIKDRDVDSDLFTDIRNLLQRVDDGCDILDMFPDDRRPK